MGKVMKNLYKARHEHYHHDLKENLYLCPQCGYTELTLDKGRFRQHLAACTGSPAGVNAARQHVPVFQPVFCGAVLLLFFFNYFWFKS